MHWFTRDWWKYLLEPAYNSGFPWCSWWQRVYCRIKGHPAGIIWYNAGGYEPDMHCRNCGDDLG